MELCSHARALWVPWLTAIAGLGLVTGYGWWYGT